MSLGMPVYKFLLVLVVTFFCMGINSLSIYVCTGQCQNLQDLNLSECSSLTVSSVVMSVCTVILIVYSYMRLHTLCTQSCVNCNCKNMRETYYNALR